MLKLGMRFKKFRRVKGLATGASKPRNQFKSGGVFR
jgi:hypothetical protein